MAKGSYGIRGRQGPSKPDAKPRSRTTELSGSLDGLAAGLQAPGTESFAFWNPPSHRPLEGSGGDDGTAKETVGRSRKDAGHSASLLTSLVAAGGRAG